MALEGHLSGPGLDIPQVDLGILAADRELGFVRAPRHAPGHRYRDRIDALAGANVVYQARRIFLHGRNDRDLNAVGTEGEITRRRQRPMPDGLAGCHVVNQHLGIIVDHGDPTAVGAKPRGATVDRPWVVDYPRLPIDVPDR